MPSGEAGDEEPLLQERPFLGDDAMASDAWPSGCLSARSSSFATESLVGGSPPSAILILVQHL